LIFKNALHAGGESDAYELIFTVYPLALFGGRGIGRNTKLLLTLINKKWPLGVDPGGHHFVD
jgi:hypothetical protein